MQHTQYNANQASAIFHSCHTNVLSSNLQTATDHLLGHILPFSLTQNLALSRPTLLLIDLSLLAQDATSCHATIALRPSSSLLHNYTKSESHCFLFIFLYSNLSSCQSYLHPPSPGNQNADFEHMTSHSLCRPLQQMPKLIYYGGVSITCCPKTLDSSLEVPARHASLWPTLALYTLSSSLQKSSRFKHSPAPDVHLTRAGLPEPMQQRRAWVGLHHQLFIPSLLCNADPAPNTTSTSEGIRVSSM